MGLPWISPGCRRKNALVTRGGPSAFRRWSVRATFVARVCLRNPIAKAVASMHAQGVSAVAPRQATVVTYKKRGPASCSPCRRGTTVVEFAIVAPLLLLLIFGMIEFGRAVMVQQLLTNASREGARRGILEQTTAEEAETVVADYLAGSSVTGATVTVSPVSLDQVGFGDPVTVTVSVPYDQVSWLPAPWFLKGTNLTAQSTMRAERPE